MNRSASVRPCVELSFRRKRYAIPRGLCVYWCGSLSNDPSCWVLTLRRTPLTILYTHLRNSDRLCHEGCWNTAGIDFGWPIQCHRAVCFVTIRLLAEFRCCQRSLEQQSWTWVIYVCYKSWNQVIPRCPPVCWPLLACKIGPLHHTLSYTQPTDPLFAVGQLSVSCESSHDLVKDFPSRFMLTLMGFAQNTEYIDAFGSGDFPS